MTSLSAPAPRPASPPSTPAVTTPAQTNATTASTGSAAPAATPPASPPGDTYAAGPATTQTARPSGTGSGGGPAVPDNAPSLDRGTLTAHMFTPRMNASAERELGPVKPNEKFGLGSQEDRVNLLRQSSQVNGVSKKAGNDGLICGGAAATNALVMSAKTPEIAKKNAEAVEKTAKELGVTPSAEQKTALQAMKDGKMSPNDVAHMQQLMYSLGKKSGVPAGGNADGMGPHQMFSLATRLKTNGAFEGSNVSFHQNQTNIDGQQTLHWTSTVDNLHMNSMNPSSKNRDKGMVLGGGTPSNLVDRSSSGFGSDVVVGDDKVTANVSGGRPPAYNRLELDIARIQGAPAESVDNRPGRPQLLGDPNLALVKNRDGSPRDFRD